MSNLGLRTLSVLCIVSFLAAFPNGSPVHGETFGPVVIDGPWANLSPDAGPGLAIDSEWGALTLKPDLTQFAFVLSPDPAKELSANSVYTLGVHNGRLYLGYGDINFNLGPIDIRAYDPLTGRLTREMTDVPEEGLGLWHVSASGRLYVGGFDARESWTFGNFFVNDGLGWQKRRTVPNGVHVSGVVEFKGRLYAEKQVDQPPFVDYPCVLVSDNEGASWSHEQIDPGPLDHSEPYSGAVSEFAVVRENQGRFIREYLYAHVSWRQAGGISISRLYRFDGQTWTHVRISTPNGELQGSKIAAVFKNQIIVFGFAGKQRSYALDHQSQKEIPFPTMLTAAMGPSQGSGEMCWAVCDGWLYWIVRDSPMQGTSFPPSAHLLCRTEDLQRWETLGRVVLPPGAMPICIGFAHGRLYVGAKDLHRGDGSDNLHPSYVYPIDNSTLHWDANVPDGSHLSFKIRTASASTSPSVFEALPWVGPDGTENTSFTTDGQILHPQHNGDDLLQVAIYRTPNLDGVYAHIRSVTVTSPGGSVTLAVDEGSGLYTAVTSTDPNGAEYRSRVFKLREPIAGGSLFFEGAAPDQTSLRLQVRSAVGEDPLAGKPFVGPDGSLSTFYHSSGQPLWSGHDGDVYLQYRGVLSSSNPVLAPFLRKVTLLTRTDAVDHFDIQMNGPAVWTAGQPNSVTVTAVSASGVPIPIQGRVSLSAVAEDSGQVVPAQPNEVTLVDGVGTLSVSLQRATPTRLCVDLAGMRAGSPVMEVQPGAPAGISVTSSLTEPLPNWSPAGQAGQPFTLSLGIVDRYRNTVTGYTGTIRCERWSWRSEAQLLTYQFQPSDQGCHEFPSGVMIDEPGEWNLLCFDETAPQIAGTLTVNIQ